MIPTYYRLKKFDSDGSDIILLLHAIYVFNKIYQLYLLLELSNKQRYIFIIMKPKS